MNRNECDLRLNGICKGGKYFGQCCSRLRPLICDVKLRRDVMLTIEKRRIKVKRADDLGIGA